MVKSILSTWAGRLMIAGGICLGLASVSQLQPGSHYVLEGIYQVSMLFLGPAYLLIALSCLGLSDRYRETFAPLARMALYACGAGAVTAIAGFGLATLNDGFRVVIMLGLTSHIGGMGMFGLANAARPVLPMPRYLPLLAGVLPLLMVLNTQTAGGGANWGPFAYLVSAGAAWLVMGVMVNREKHVDVQPAAA